MRIAIASGKGGTGKTTLSTNLAMYLSETRKVILADLDVEEPNSGLFIKAELLHAQDMYKNIPVWNRNNCILCGHCQEVCNFHAVLKLGKQVVIFPELCHGCHACSELCPAHALPLKKQKMGELKHYSLANLDFVESRLEIGQEQAVPLISQTLNYLKTRFGNNLPVICDSPPGTACPMIKTTQDADLVILVTEPTPFGLHDLILAIETMRELHRDFVVVINRFGIGNDEVIRYCEAEKIRIIARFPNDRHIAELYSRGELIYPRHPVFKQQLEAVASYILSQEGDLQ